LDDLSEVETRSLQGPCRWILFSPQFTRAQLAVGQHTDLTLSSFDLVLFFARLSPEVNIVPEIRHGEYVVFDRFSTYDEIAKLFENILEKISAVRLPVCRIVTVNLAR